MRWAISHGCLIGGAVFGVDAWHSSLVHCFSLLHITRWRVILVVTRPVLLVSPRCRHSLRFPAILVHCTPAAFLKTSTQLVPGLPRCLCRDNKIDVKNDYDYYSITGSGGRVRTFYVHVWRVTLQNSLIFLGKQIPGNARLSAIIDIFLTIIHHYENLAFRITIW